MPRVSRLQTLGLGLSAKMACRVKEHCFAVCPAQLKARVRESGLGDWLDFTLRMYALRPILLQSRHRP